MELNGIVQNGVIVLTGDSTLPEGTPVTVTCGADAITQPPTKERKYVKFPLVESDSPGNTDLTNERIAEILDAEDAAAARC